MARHRRQGQHSSAQIFHPSVTRISCRHYMASKSSPPCDFTLDSDSVLLVGHATANTQISRLQLRLLSPFFNLHTFFPPYTQQRRQSLYHPLRIARTGKDGSASYKSVSYATGLGDGGQCSIGCRQWGSLCHARILRWQKSRRGFSPPATGLMYICMVISSVILHIKYILLTSILLAFPLRSPSCTI